MIFIDTNYFLRLLLNDNPDQHLQVKQLFEKAALGKIKLFSNTLVFFEVYWVASSFYQKEKKAIVSLMATILSLDFIAFEEDVLLGDALRVFRASNLGLVDCYNLVYARKNNAKSFKTFDKKLEKSWEDGE